MNPIPHHLDEELSPADKERALKFIRYLQDNFEDLQDEGRIPFSWTRKAAGDLDVGFDLEARAPVYSQWSGMGKVVGLKWDGSPAAPSRLWPLNVKHLFDPGALRWIVFVQDEHAAVGLRSWRLPVVCSSGGIENLPDDLSWLSQYDRVIVVLSNDEGGWSAMLNLANAILQQCPDTEVLLYRWPAGTPDGFGVEEFCEVATQEDFKKQILERAAVYKSPAGDHRGRSAEKVVAALKSAGGELDRTTLMRKTRLLKHDLDETLASLEEQGLVSVVSKPRERPQGGGRSVVVISWIEGQP